MGFAGQWHLETPIEEIVERAKVASLIKVNRNHEKNIFNTSLLQ
jgi:hypothetical protein